MHAFCIAFFQVLLSNNGYQAMANFHIKYMSVSFDCLYLIRDVVSFYANFSGVFGGKNGF